MSDYKDIKTIAKEVRQTLNKEYPDCTWSVSIERYAGGQSMSVRLMSAPFPAFARDVTSNGYPQSQHTQLNDHQFREHNDDYLNNGSYLTPEAWECLAKAVKIANRDNWDNSDIQSDYFDVNYYLHLAIGKWDKPFTQTAKIEDNRMPEYTTRQTRRDIRMARAAEANYRITKRNGSPMYY